jgi:hypothetical protein
MAHVGKQKKQSDGQPEPLVKKVVVEEILSAESQAE